MIYSVVSKGIDIDNSQKMDDVIIKVPGGYRSDPVKLCDIDMFNEPAVTRRKIIIEKDSPLTQSFLRFYIRLLNADIKTGYWYDNSSDRKPRLRIPVQYPQKHIVDIEIHGANGSTGFLPGHTNYSSLESILSNKIPASLASLFDVWMRRKIPDDAPYSSEREKSNILISGWQICERDWWSYIANNNDADFDPKLTEQMYTRECGRDAALFNNRENTFEEFQLYKYLNMFYSDANLFTIRVTIEMDDTESKKITFEKYASSNIQTT